MEASLPSASMPPCSLIASSRRCTALSSDLVGAGSAVPPSLSFVPGSTVPDFLGGLEDESEQPAMKISITKEAEAARMRELLRNPGNRGQGLRKVRNPQGRVKADGAGPASASRSRIGG